MTVKCEFKVGRFYRNNCDRLMKVLNTDGRGMYGFTPQPIIAFDYKARTDREYTVGGYFGADKGEFYDSNLVLREVLPSEDEIDKYGIPESDILRPKGHALCNRQVIVKAVELGVHGTFDIKNGVIQSGSDAEFAIDSIVNLILGNVPGLLVQEEA